ncbi:hypothetical protein ACH5RR_009368 [Cinchona calisaya]|uniref:DUF7806 domain-containing protein n=1 Tax=Cinchona calisaya TaxID=153742 RepID=A0ABD3AE43_9GENT
MRGWAIVEVVAGCRREKDKGFRGLGAIEVGGEGEMYSFEIKRWEGKRGLGLGVEEGSTKNEECIQLHARLMEENRNLTGTIAYKELAKEIERLRSLQREGRCCQARDDKVDNGPVDVPGSSQAESHSSDVVSVKKARKRSRQSLYRRHDKYNPSASEELGHAQLNVSANGSCKQTEANDAPPKYYQPACSKRKINNSGNDVTDCAPACCLFQDLIEFVVGMKLYIIAQNEEFCVSVLHPSSGYSFSLTWVNNSNNEPELLYRVLSLGTFERVAPEWMRNVLMFSTSMCPIFFQRVSRIIQLNH